MIGSLYSGAVIAIKQLNCYMKVTSLKLQKFIPLMIALMSLHLSPVVFANTVIGVKSLDSQVQKILNDEGGDIGPTACIFCGRDKFISLIGYLPGKIDEIDTYISENKNVDKLYILGMAIQYLPFEEFIKIQSLIISTWREKKISNKEFKVLFVLPMRTTGRLIYSHKNPLIENIIKEIRSESGSIDLSGTGLSKELLESIESGHMRRVYRRDKTTFEKYDDDTIANYSKVDKVFEVILDGVYPSIIFGIILLAIGVALRIKKIRLGSIVTFVLSICSFGFSWMCQVGIIVL